MIGHEIVSVLVATVMAVAFVSAIKPGSQMNGLLSSSLGGWNSILGTIGQGGGGTSGG